MISRTMRRFTATVGKLRALKDGIWSLGRLIYQINGMENLILGEQKLQRSQLHAMAQAISSNAAERRQADHFGILQTRGLAALIRRIGNDKGGHPAVLSPGRVAPIADQIEAFRKAAPLNIDAWNDFPLRDRLAAEARGTTGDLPLLLRGLPI